MPSYNLPVYTPTPPLTRSPCLTTDSKTHQRPQDRHGTALGPLPPPAHLVPHMFAFQPTPPRSKLSYPRCKLYCHSPLSTSTLHPAHVIALRQLERTRPAPSKRYLAVVPPSAGGDTLTPLFVPKSRLDSMRGTLRLPNFGLSKSRGRQIARATDSSDRTTTAAAAVAAQAMVEQALARGEETRLWAIVLKTKFLGERVGVGLSSGRDMVLWAALSRIRLERLKSESEAGRAVIMRQRSGA